MFRNHDGSSSQAGDEIETRTIICFQNPRPEHFDHALLQVCAGNIIQRNFTSEASYTLTEVLDALESPMVTDQLVSLHDLDDHSRNHVLGHRHHPIQIKH